MRLTKVYLQAKFWRLYVEAQLAANDDDAVKQIFSRCLLQCLHVDLWLVLFSNFPLDLVISNSELLV